jgi:taurine transport system ATP-binding protein
VIHGHKVEMSRLNHRFTTRTSRVEVLQDIDITIEPGEFVTLAGPSGCGKTTLLRLVAGFLSPTEGTISVGGTHVTRPGAERGVVFQHPTLLPWLSVRDNVELGPKLRGVHRGTRRERAAYYLSLVGLEEAAERRPYELSGGMQQRCQIARALTNDPDIVLMDEPFGALDALTRERLQQELHDIWRSTGKTILFITHSVDEAVLLGSRVMVMSSRPGRVVLDEPTVFDEGHRGSDVDAMRELPEYLDLRTRVRDAIWQAPRTAGAAT